MPCYFVTATRDRQLWIQSDGRLVEVERYVEHDAVMNSWNRFAIGLPVLGRIHSTLRLLEVDEAAKTPLFANYIEAANVFEQTRRGTQRIRSWNGPPNEAQLAIDTEELASLVADTEQAVTAQLPRQLVQGNFWDNNVFWAPIGSFRGTLRAH